MSSFPDPINMSISSLIFMMGVYGFILMKASEIISDGSEMLLLLYGPGIIGGLVIPMLGAVPDCAIILISGMGSGTKAEIQHELSVGVGTLVGSTVMLLTIPWAIGVFLGRKEYDEVTKKASGTRSKNIGYSLTKTCVTVLPQINQISKVMMLSSLSYLIIQIPAFFYKNTSDGGISEEAPYAIVGVFVTFSGFVIYCINQIQSASSQEMVKLQAAEAAIEDWKKNMAKQFEAAKCVDEIFDKYDKDKNGYLDLKEIEEALKEFKLKLNRAELLNFINKYDVGHEDQGKVDAHDGRLSRKEFAKLAADCISKMKGVKDPKQVADKTQADLEKGNSYKQLDNSEKDNEHRETHDDADEEEEEDQLLHLTNNQILIQACFLLFIGTLICTFVSDPMVDVITHVGNKLNISPFYVSFVVTPIASNASEVISGLIFAQKRTVTSISLTLSTFHGAATMNSTLALCIFMSIVYFRGLSWSFSAEVITVLFVIVSVGLNALKETIHLWQALLVLLLYPFSIYMVYFMENIIGLD